MKINIPSKKVNNIDLTPMVSIVFLLIIFFLIAGTVRAPEFWKIDLPKSTSGQTVNHKLISIHLNHNGQIAYAKQKISLKELLGKIKSSTNGAIIKIHADKNVDSLKLVELLSNLESTLVKKIVLVTRSNF